MTETNKTSFRVLILDAEFVAALTILRSLSRQGIQCDIASSTDKPISQSSRHANTHYKYPDPLVDAEGFTDFICSLLQDKQYDLVIPVTERSLIPLSDSNKLEPWRDKLAIAEKNSLDQVLDKAKTLELAKKHDISTPFSQAVNSLEEVNQFADSLDYPVVLKPGRSIPNADQRRQLNVTYAHNRQELIQHCQDLLPYCELLIQQYAQGIGTGIELLANQGTVVYAFQHQRIHEIPLSGGGSCLRKSMTPDPILLKAAETLISALNWHGVAMVEFKWQPETGNYWLMEINGRFWGSLPLADAAGADFPFMLFNLLVLNKLPQSTNYKKNIYCRKLSTDLYWLEQVLRKTEDSALVSYPETQQIISDCALFLHPTRHFLDVQSFTDPLPGLIDLFSITKQYYQRLAELIQFKALLKYHASNFKQKCLKKQLQKSKSVLFLCYGNINRSALAHAIAEQSSEKNDITFFSTGFHTEDKRPADVNMVKVAAANKVDLSNSLSTTINNDIVNQADIILAMEIQHLERLYASFPKAKNKSFLLGTLTANQNPNVEISDPYGQGDSIFKNAFNRIKATIEQLTQLLSTESH